MLSHSFDNYWNKTETFEALRDYIVMNYKGLKEAIIELLAGKRLAIDISSFNNDMTTFSSADDVLTLFIHLGYLGYDFPERKCLFQTVRSQRNLLLPYEMPDGRK